jgi:hypothetical protein
VQESKVSEGGRLDQKPNDRDISHDRDYFRIAYSLSILSLSKGCLFLFSFGPDRPTAFAGQSGPGLLRPTFLFHP